MNTSRTTVIPIALVLFGMACAPCTLLAPIRTSTATPTPPPSPMDAPIPTVTLAATWTPKAASPTAPTIAGALHPVRPVSDVLSGEFQRFHRTGDAVWLVSDAGFARLEDGAWRVVVSDVAGTPVGEDAAGRPWVVSPDTEMIAVWERSGWTAYGDDIGGVVFEPGGEEGRDSPVSPSQDRRTPGPADQE